MGGSFSSLPNRQRGLQKKTTLAWTLPLCPVSTAVCSRRTAAAPRRAHDGARQKARHILARRAPEPLGRCCCCALLHPACLNCHALRSWFSPLCCRHVKMAVQCVLKVKGSTKTEDQVAARGGKQQMRCRCAGWGAISGPRLCSRAPPCLLLTQTCRCCLLSCCFPGRQPSWCCCRRRLAQLVRPSAGAGLPP